ncbi:SRPBCC domain-containing protein [Gulosibacter molinativorax]|uniref:SRPBCC domain-containing protein n=1 Tax=Gulosibacter molinativorax TaxID=256821 RepID=UPI001B7FE8D4|nr:SRPBCC domain-containing protein [Gulosibacter molinativorax]QUY60993.1 Polyketide cyclase [Gulosibacter molinativorax]
MSIDPQVFANTVRELHASERDGVATKTAVIRSVFPASQAEVWDAVSSSERIPEWFLPITGNLEVGGHYQTEGNAGGTIEACDAPNSYAITWEFGGQSSWVRVELSPAEDGTELALIHEAPIGDGAFWKQYGPGATGVGRGARAARAERVCGCDLGNRSGGRRRVECKRGGTPDDSTHGGRLGGCLDRRRGGSGGGQGRGREHLRVLHRRIRGTGARLTRPEVTRRRRHE